MSLTLQKAGLWKRVSAFLFDIIFTITIAMGFAAITSAVFDYNGHIVEMQARYAVYEEEYGVDFDITEEEYEKLTEEEKATMQEAYKSLNNDEELLKIQNLLFYMTLAILSISAFLAILFWQFIIPLFFKNGQTLGKKIFGIAVMRTNSVKVTNPVLFIRAMIGMFAIETMFPLFMLIMIYFGALGIVGVITILLLLGLQIGVMIYTKTNSAIHDLLCDTVVVDFASQMIFETEEALMTYQQEKAQQNVLNSSN